MGLTALHPRAPLLLRAVGLAQVRDLLLEGAGPGRGERGSARAGARCFSALGYISVTWGVGTKHRCLSSAQAWLNSPGAAEVESAGLRV